MTGIRRSRLAFAATLGVLLSVVPSAPPRAHAAGPSVALIHAESITSWIDDVANKLWATGAFANVTKINAMVATPTLSQLQAHHAVLVWSNGSFHDGTLLGDRLADYVDAGGQVALATFAHACQGAPYALVGRIATYSPFTCSSGNSSGVPLTLSPVIATDSLLANVDSFHGGSSSYHNVLGTQSGAVLVAKWSNGRPLIATKTRPNGTRVIGLNFFPPSSSARSDFWQANTSGAMILRNALMPLDLTITEAPPAATKASSATFQFKVIPAGNPMTCALDGGPASLCTSPKAYSGLSEGTHTFEVATTAYGVTLTRTHAWVIDRTAPATTITAAPPEWHGSTTATFEFQANEPATFQCVLDGTLTDPCASPFVRTLAEGEHSFSVRATDLAGNAEFTPRTATFNIDVTPPDTSLGSGPAEWSNDPSPRFEFSSTEPGSFSCVLDATPLPDCTSPLNLAVAEGAHTFTVAAVDRAGNTDPSPATASWTTDFTPPETEILGGPPATSSSGDATISFRMSEPGTLRCALDGAPAAPCTSPIQFQGLPDGTHELQVWGVDYAGNADPTPATHTWIVDLLPPDVAITAPKAGAVYFGGTQVGSSPLSGATLFAPGTFSITANIVDATPARAEFFVDGAKICTVTAAPFRCDWSPAALSGEHVIRVVATDAVGRKGSAEVRATVY